MSSKRDSRCWDLFSTIVPRSVPLPNMMVLSRTVLDRVETRVLETQLGTLVSCVLHKLVLAAKIHNSYKLAAKSQRNSAPRQHLEKLEKVKAESPNVPRIFWVKAFV